MKSIEPFYVDATSTLSSDQKFGALTCALRGRGSKSGLRSIVPSNFSY